MGNVPSAEEVLGQNGENVANGLSPQTTSVAIVLYRWKAATSSISKRATKTQASGAWDLITEDAKLGVYNSNEDAANKPPLWNIEIEAGTQESIDAPIDDEYIFDAANNRVTFAAASSTWALRFPTSTAFNIFLQRYNKAVFENRSGLEMNEANEAKIFGQDFMMQLGPETDASRQAWVDDMDIDEQPHPSEMALRTPTKDITVGRQQESNIRGVIMGAGGRSYLVRESGQLDVMRNVSGGVEDTGLALNLLTPPGSAAGTGTPGSSRSTRGSSTTTRGRSGTPITPGSVSSFVPTKSLLTKGETAMNMISPNTAASSLFHTDLETGKVVSEWAFARDGVDVAIKDIANDTKTAQLEQNSTFLALGDNRLARWDLRDPRGAVQEAMASPAALSYIGGKDYARGTKFNCMATSGDGFIAVGSNDGRVRLYSEKTLTQAKTSIPGLGLPITAIDVTFDGKWVLATTKSYLMVLKTTYKDPKSGKELCGFTSRMGSNAPAPRLLRLRPEDAAAAGNAPLERGHFAWVTQRGRQERWIVASCGNFTVLWNFRTVKIIEPSLQSYGGLTTVTEYNMIPKGEQIVDSVFMADTHLPVSGHGVKDAMVVVTKKHVYTVRDESSSDEDDD